VHKKKREVMNEIELWVRLRNGSATNLHVQLKEPEVNASSAITVALFDCNNAQINGNRKGVSSVGRQ
jgi:hypothetical protein